MESRVESDSTGRWQDFWEVMALNENPIAATDRPTVSFETYQIYCREIAQKLMLSSNDVLLDIGCGTGLMNAHLGSRVRKVIATDYAFNMTVAAKRNSENLANVHIVTCSGLNTPFPNQTFSKVVLYAVTQYLSEQRFLTILFELKRITQSGSMILFGEIPRGRDDRFVNRVREVWVNEGFLGTLKKIRDRLVEVSLIWLGRYTSCRGYVRPMSPPTWHPFPEQLLDLVNQAGMSGQILPQSKDLPWFHQSLDLQVIND
jgi:ubiquinone/menaquinone biosynthesis C-methylase UbiE